MTHYDTLGITPDATPEEIKAAFKRQASKHHPDRKQGDNERMSEINRAMDVLSNPERRAHYDKTGEDKKQGNSFENMVRQCVAQAFSQALSKEGNTVRMATDWVHGQIAHLEKEKQGAKRYIASMEKRRKQIKLKKKKTRADNIAHNIIDDMIRGAKNQIDNFDEAIRISNAAIKEINGYESEEEELQTPRFGQAGSGWIKLG